MRELQLITKTTELAGKDETTVTQKTYRAASLEQVAVMFDSHAKRATEAQGRSTTQKTKAIESARAVTWQTAADILRQTELHNAEWTNEPQAATASVNAATSVIPVRRISK